LRLCKFGKDSGRASVGGWHGCFGNRSPIGGIANESVWFVTVARQSSVTGNPSLLTALAQASIMISSPSSASY
jgi:hypothetical protein